jgi:hypothetical protein
MLFVVAGYPASGKSNALGLAASKGIALFPPRYDRDFKACLPGEVLEELTPTAEKLQRRMWLAYVDGPAFARIEPKPQHAVYHMDILLHLLNDIRPRAMSDFTNEAIRGSFEAFFAGPFWSAYAERAVTTLYPDFLILRSRWGARMEKMGETDNPNMQMKDQIIVGRHGRDLYRRVMTIWVDMVDRTGAKRWVLRAGKNGNGLPYRQIAMVEA